MADQADELAELRGRVSAARSTTKALIRSARTALAFLADLDERLERFEATHAQPKEAQRNERDTVTSR
jgi:hypothetical protein